MVETCRDTDIVKSERPCVRHTAANSVLLCVSYGPLSVTDAINPFISKHARL